MSIEQYKEALVSLVKEMEKEHGCGIRTVRIKRLVEYSGPYKSVSYEVEIDL